MINRRTYRFGAYRLDATRKVLLRDGEPLHAPKKAVETLLVLVENTGQVLTKEELMSRLWPGRVVDEANLAQNIAVVRKVLGAERGAPGFIETFSGTGYRILGPVSAVEEDVEAVPVAVAPPEPPVAIVPAAPTPLPVMEPEPVKDRKWWWIGGAAVVAGITLSGLWVTFRGVTSQPAELHRIPVTRLTGKEYQPAISPDGQNIAFVWERDSASLGSIWVQREGSDSPARITPNDGASYISPVWSPDGRQLAFLRFAEGQGALIVSSATGSDARNVMSLFPSRYGLQHRHLDWSPDGRFLAVDDAQSAGRPFGIFVVSVADGQKRRLTSTDDVHVGDVNPRFSPDGNAITFVRAFHRANQELFVVPFTGGAPVQLTSDDHQISDHAWMPDGSQLVFASDRTGEFRLWKMNPVAGGKPESTGVYGDYPLQLSMAKATNALVYAALQHNLDIWRLDLRPEKGGERWLKAIASTGQDASPQYSPRGDRICFRSERSGDEQIWVAGPDGSNPVKVTRGSLRPSVARWSPDGASLIFNHAGTRELYVARPGQGGEWEVKATGMQGVHPVYSPDGGTIYAGTMTSIIRIPAQGGKAAEVTPTMGISLDASGDGRFIYFVREPAGTALWRVEVSNGRLEKVLEGLVPYCSSCWALSGKGIFYLRKKEQALDRQALYFMEFATGRESHVIDYPEVLSPLGSGPFSLSPDGRYLLCVRVAPSDTDVFRVESFH